MFNELTLTLHVLLLVSIYLFLFVVVRTISRDVKSSGFGSGTLNANNVIEQLEPDEDYPKIMVADMETGNSDVAHVVYDEIVIGRAQDCDIVLADTFVSSRHARVFQLGDDFWLEDLGSTNGTTFDQAKVAEPIRLVSDDEFIISKYKFRFVM